LKIAADKNQFAGSHGISNAKKHIQIERDLGHELFDIPLPFGDYCLITDEMQETIDRRGSKLKKQDLVGDIKISVDSKKDLQEVCGNICSGSHSRFRDEVILAQKCGCKLYILVEEPKIKSIDDVFRWQNPRMHRYNKIKYMHGIGKWGEIKLPKKPPTSGETLAKACLTMQLKYGVEFVFCSPNESGAMILKLLGVITDG
jgi:hypothetical protein